MKKFAIMSLLICAVPFFAENFENGPFISSCFLILFLLAISLGLFPKAPRRNALSVIPALVISILFTLNTALGSVPDLPWGAAIFTSWLAAGVLFFRYDRLEEHSANID